MAVCHRTAEGAWCECGCVTQPSGQPVPRFRYVPYAILRNGLTARSVLLISQSAPRWICGIRLIPPLKDFLGRLYGPSVPGCRSCTVVYTEKRRPHTLAPAQELAHPSRSCRPPGAIEA